MKTIEQIETSFRQWVRKELEEILGDEPNNVKYGIFPVKRFVHIAIEETYLYIARKKWRAPIQKTADCLGVTARSVNNALGH